MLTDDQLLSLFRQEQLARNNSEKTIIYYMQALKAFKRYYNLDLAAATAADIKAFLVHERSCIKNFAHPYKPSSGKLSSATVRTYFNALRGFYNWAAAQGYTADIFASVKAPRKRKRTIDILTAAEIDILMAAVAGSPRNELLVLLMLDCGLRCSEVTGLRRFDVYDGYIKVCGKGDKERLVPVSAYTFDKIAAFLRADPLHGAHDLLLCMSNNAVKMVFARLKRKTGIVRLRPHLLRHTFATLYILNGGDSVKLQYVLGHSTLHMINTYVHLANSLRIIYSQNFSPFSAAASDKKCT